jgi:hypothetical protein
VVRYTSVVSGPDGSIYAATRSPDHIIQIDPTSGAVTPVVGHSGYNGTSDDSGPFAGTQVQVNLDRPCAGGDRTAQGDDLARRGP